jgi:hypothetical protein
MVVNASSRSNAPTPPGKSRSLSDELKKILREPGRASNIEKVKKLLKTAFGGSKPSGSARGNSTS